MRKEQMKVLVKCSICDKEYQIGYKSNQVSEKRGTPHVCRQCNAKRNTESLREGYGKYFADPENRQKHINRCKESWNNRPEEFKEKRINDLRIIGKEYRNREDYPKIISERMTKYFNNPENRKKSSELKKKWWTSLSKDDKVKHMTHLVEYWDSASDKNIDSWYKNMLDGAVKSGSILTGKTEKDFVNDLIRIPLVDKKVNYIHQYRSTIKHPDFDKLFPINITTGRKGINPYHVWDFMIYGINKNLLVDIDGSIHSGKRTKYRIKHKSGRVLTFDEIIQFGDKQRPYQTDGLDAYIIKAYDDKLSDDVEVFDISKNQSITYKDLMNIILRSQLSDSDIRKLANKSK